MDPVEKQKAKGALALFGVIGMVLFSSGLVMVCFGLAKDAEFMAFQLLAIGLALMGVSLLAFRLWR